MNVVVSSVTSKARRSAVDILNEAPGGLVFKTAADVAAYLKEEKDAWDRQGWTKRGTWDGKRQESNDWRRGHEITGKNYR